MPAADRQPIAAESAVSRRCLLRAGGLSLFGGPLILRSAQTAESVPTRRPARARSVVLIDLFGGPSHIDMFDPKPDAPPEVRGEFAPIGTALPGVHYTEHLPKLAAWADRTCLIRTVSHGYNSHNPYAVMTGFTGGKDAENYFAKPSDHPGMGSVLQYFGVGVRNDLPGYVCLPAFPGYGQSLRRAGPYGGYLGDAYDPFFSTCEPQFTRAVTDKDAYDHTLVPLGDPKLPDLQPGLTPDLLDRRRTLLGRLDEQARTMDPKRVARLTGLQQQAFHLLLSPTARTAFDLGQESPETRERYGRDLLGGSVLLARRLVESGVSFVTVHTEAKGNGHWDTHENNFNMLRAYLLPFLDRAVTALLEDLSARGLLETTLVIVTGDMGRTPRVNRKAGRDHWPQCGFCLLAGGGTRPGLVYGTSDRQGGLPLNNRVTPGDIVSTVYHLMGLDPELTVPDHANRPIAINQGGRPIAGVLA